MVELRVLPRRVRPAVPRGRAERRFRHERDHRRPRRRWRRRGGAADEEETGRHGVLPRPVPRGGPPRGRPRRRLEARRERHHHHQRRRFPGRIIVVVSLAGAVVRGRSAVGVRRRRERSPVRPGVHRRRRLRPRGRDGFGRQGRGVRGGQDRTGRHRPVLLPRASVDHRQGGLDLPLHRGRHPSDPLPPSTLPTSGLQEAGRQVPSRPLTNPKRSEGCLRWRVPVASDEMQCFVATFSMMHFSHACVSALRRSSHERSRVSSLSRWW
mmetsp:Transcript_1192/g.2825  ORF Transcript_1192/g.2825 Transcript_1192/m.2825 type:complete len:267 (+) Transcript_1192:410-1210(+)